MDVKDRINKETQDRETLSTVYRQANKLQWDFPFSPSLTFGYY